MKRTLFSLMITAFGLSLITGCGGGEEKGSDSNFAGLKDFTDSVNYAIGVKSGTNFKSGQFEIRPDVCSKGIEYANQPAGSNKPQLQADRNDTVNFNLGYNITRGLGQMKFEIREAAIIAGMTDCKNGTQKIDDAGIARILKNFEEKMMGGSPEVLMKKGQDFLAANRAADGVKETPSGIQYKVVKSGTGKTPKPENQVECHYRGTLVDGTVFDSSYDRGQPATFPVMGVIQGWQEILQMMKEGDKWEVWIPYELAYGPQGRPGIPPYSMLKFEMELLKVL